MEIFRVHDKNLPIAVIGDLHEGWDIIKKKIKDCEMENAILFQAGDFGIGFAQNNPKEVKKGKKRLQLLNNFLKKRNIFLYVIRGNHDNPNFFDGKHNASNVIFMQDYDVIQVGDKKILGFGGALTIDRKENPNFPNLYGKPYPGRREGIDWWPEAERVVYDKKKISKLREIDVIIAHGCPEFAYPPVRKLEDMEKWIEYDPELEREIPEERKTFTQIFNKIVKNNDIKYYIYGHYHKKHVEERNGIEFWMLEKEVLTELRF